jgi:sec-independent protein translocase protein TatB
MFDIAPTELLVVAIVALVVIGPKDLPRVMRTVGHWVSRARGMARHFRSGIDTMIRETELEDMQKQWAAQNDRIMREHPMPPSGAAPDPPPRPPAAETPPAADEAQAEASDSEPAPAPPRRPAPAAPRRRAPPAPPRELP